MYRRALEKVVRMVRDYRLNAKQTETVYQLAAATANRS